MYDHGSQKCWEGYRYQPHWRSSLAATLKVLARVFRWLRMLQLGRFSTINGPAVADKINASSLSQTAADAAGEDVGDAILDRGQLEMTNHH